MAAMATTHRLQSDDGTDLAIHAAGTHHAEAVLFVHGATYGGRPAFAVPGYSWLAACADRGRAGYAVDVRGYGESGRPASMDAPPGGEPPVRVDTAADDLTAALSFIRERHHTVHLVGYSWGSMTAGVACERGEHVDSVTLYAPVYNPAPERMADFQLADPPAPRRTVTRQEARQRWDSHLPEPSRYRDKEAFEAFWSAVHKGQGIPGDDPTIEAPNGTLADLSAAAEGDLPYDAEAVTAPALVVRGSLDQTATRPDALGLYDSLGSEDREYAEVAGGSHFLAAERRRTVLFDRVAAFHDRVGE